LIHFSSRPCCPSLAGAVSLIPTYSIWRPVLRHQFAWAFVSCLLVPLRGAPDPLL
jgi:hypothetical protein